MDLAMSLYRFSRYGVSRLADFDHFGSDLGFRVQGR